MPIVYRAAIRSLCIVAVLLFGLLLQNAGATRTPQEYSESRQQQQQQQQQQSAPTTTTARRRNQWLWLWWKEKAVAVPNDSDDHDDFSNEILVRTSASTTKNGRTPLHNRHQSKKHPSKSKPKTAKTTNPSSNCHHLITTAATTAGSSSEHSHTTKSRFVRVWKRMSLPRRHLRRSASSTHRNVNMNWAYSMGIAATLSYWEFHKKPLPTHHNNNNHTSTSLEIVSYRNGYAQSLRPTWRARFPLRAVLQRVVSRVRLTLHQANPWLSLVVVQSSSRRRQPRTIQRRQQQQTNPQSSFKNQHHAQQQQLHQQQHNTLQLEYSLYNWYEPTPLGKYHDTDILVATTNHDGQETLIVAFAGTASVPDTVTNLQTFESIQHSKFFHNSQNKTASWKGSMHRGFLNAYSRVARGSILKLCHHHHHADNNNNNAKRGNHHCHVKGSLFRDYGHCTAKEELQQHSANTNNSTTTTTWKQGRGCKVKHRKLMTILRELTTEYLSAGKSVHLVGHSLGGALATLHALDIILNFPNVPVHKLDLWTFGGAQLADDAFYQSALTVVPRLENFLQMDSIMGSHLESSTPVGNRIPVSKRRRRRRRRRRSQCHRFVTVSDDCQVDFVSTVAQKTLAPEKEHNNFHGKTARKLGGIRGNSSVVHLVDPYYLLTPDQYNDIAVGIPTSKKKQGNKHLVVAEKKKTTKTNTAPLSASPQNKEKQPSSTRSTIAAHSASNYLKGISRESRDYPLSTDLPLEVRQWLGEIIVL